MACPCSARFFCDFRVYNSHGCRVGYHNMIGNGRRLHLIGTNESLKQDSVTLHQLCTMWVPIKHVPSRCDVFVCRSVLIPGGGRGISLLKSATVALTRLFDTLQQSPIVLRLIPAVSIITFSAWGLGPLLRLGRILFLQRTDSSWNESRSRYVMTSYLQPLLLWTGAILICRALDPVVLPSEASQAVKQRLLNFIRSLSTVLALAFCILSSIQQVQKFFKETNDSSDPRNMGFDFAGKAIYTAVWVAAVSSFMELLGFSAQKWLTAGGLGTVLITLAGREILTNFLSGLMIHATRPFAIDEWIQTKIQGYEVSGTVEHVGWWSPTIVRGDDREAVHIPNHKFTVNVVRNLSQKSHWRIKTHIAINHLDVNKINIIVADMRKVLAKNPQVEQQRLHRRVFLENINPENQALLILISCFVKTSRFEEYLYVKEGILLDLLRVVSHHGVRLATPIRTVQKMYSDNELENEPSDDTISTHSSAATHRPLLLAESAYKINEDRVNTSTLPKEKNEEKDTKTDESLIPDSKSEKKPGPVRVSDLQNDDRAVGTTASTPRYATKFMSSSGTEAPKMGYDDSVSKSSKLVEQKNDRSEDIGEGTFAAASTELPQNVPVTGPGETLSAIPQAKEDDDKSVSAPSAPRPSFEDNLVLGVALEGSKRTLPIDEEVNRTPLSTESKGLGNQERGVSRPPPGKDKKDGHAPNPFMKKND